jgi:hypothetical protein
MGPLHDEQSPADGTTYVLGCLKERASGTPAG